MRPGIMFPGIHERLRSGRHDIPIYQEMKLRDDPAAGGDRQKRKFPYS